MEPGRDRAGGGPLEAAAGLAGGPATGGVQASRTAQASHAGTGLRLFAGPCALGLRRHGKRPTDPEQMLYKMPAFNVFRDGRVCPGSHKFPEDWSELIPESFFQSYFSGTGDSKDRSKKHPDNLHALWEEMDGKTEYPVMRTLFPSARWPRSSRPPRGGGLATARTGPGPVGYLVNHREGLAGAHGIGFDYVLGTGGLYVQSESAHLTARVLVAPCDGAGAGLRHRKGGARPRPNPGPALRGGAALVPGRPPHRAVLRRAVGRALLPAGGARTGGDGHVASSTRRPPGVVAEFHSHGRSRAFFSKTDDGDEQGLPHLRRRGTPRHRPARAEPPGRRLRPLRPGGVDVCLRRPAPRPTAGERRRTGIDR